MASASPSKKPSPVLPNDGSRNRTPRSDWSSAIEGYRTYLELEKGLSANSVQAYIRDIDQFARFAQLEEGVSTPAQIEMQHVEHFMGSLFDRGLARNSQARMLSGSGASANTFGSKVS